jgi:peptidoglycan/xylan/chitin deacetylase (PgdA/CDA1 family)
MNRIAKAWLSKVNFELGRNPKLVASSDRDHSRSIPAPYRAVLLISADFELAWAWRYAIDSRNPRENAVRLARNARQNIPRILEICDRYDVPVTWATVGHLFLNGCRRNGNVPHANLKRVTYHENPYWRFDRGEWFDDDPCTSWKTSPEWYAPDLIDRILDSRVGHEVACHTFSHIDCRDGVCAPQVLINEVRECRKFAADYGLKLESFIHPGHLIGNLDLLGKLGFSSFRSDYANVLGYPKKYESGLWEFSSTAELAFRKEWSVDYHVYRYRKIIEKAVTSNRVCCFWFHPSMDNVMVNDVMPAVFESIAAWKNKLLVTTHSNYVKILESNSP